MMKKFIKDVCIFLICLGFSSLILQAIISLRINADAKVHGILEQSSNVNADLVLLGSSRCWSHLQPEFFDTTFKLKSINLGVNGHEELSMATVRLKHYLLKNKPPKYAILSFDPFCTPGSETNNSDFFLKKDFAQYAFFPNSKNLLIVNYFKFNFLEKYIPLYAAFKYQLFSLDLLSGKNVSNHMFYTSEFFQEKWDTIITPIPRSVKHIFSKDEISALTNSLMRLNKLCLQHHIKLLCIQTPAYKNLYDEDAFTMTNKICRNPGIPFVDANKKFIRDNINYFYNPNHLNKTGLMQMNGIFRKDSTLASFFKF